MLKQGQASYKLDRCLDQGLIMPSFLSLSFYLFLLKLHLSLLNFKFPFSLHSTSLSKNPLLCACIAGLGLTYQFPHQVRNLLIKTLFVDSGTFFAPIDQ